jgi:hypothetical protein
LQLTQNTYDLSVAYTIHTTIVLQHSRRLDKVQTRHHVDGRGRGTIKVNIMVKIFKYFKFLGISSPLFGN